MRIVVLLAATTIDSAALLTAPKYHTCTVAEDDIWSCASCRSSSALAHRCIAAAFRLAASARTASCCLASSCKDAQS